MLKAVEIAIRASKAYVEADEVSVDLANQLYEALERMLRAASVRNINIAEEYDRYTEWLEKIDDYN